MSGHVVRRLTPMECERLQGMPDDHTRIRWRGKPAEECPDGPRYKAIGNSMAVPVMRWIGERIGMVDAILLNLNGYSDEQQKCNRMTYEEVMDYMRSMEDDTVKA